MEEEDEENMDEEFIKPQEERFDQELEKAEGNIELALENMIGGKDKSKNFIELAKRNIDLDFEDNNTELPSMADNTTGIPGKSVMFKRKGGENKKKREIIKVNLEED